MKNIFLISLLILTGLIKAQNNVFPLPSGNTGLGTTSPSSKLTIYDPVNNTTAGQEIRIGQTTNVDYSIGRNPVSGYLDFSGGQTGYVGYTFSNGRLGIGTATNQVGTIPQKLTVQTTEANDGIRIIQSSTGTDAAALHMYNLTAGGHNWALFSTGINSTQGAGNFCLYDYSTSLNRLFIKGSDGNIGIGTITPSAKLDVIGNTRFAVPSNATSAFEIVSNPTTNSRFKVFGDGKTYVGNFTSPAYDANASILTVGQSITGNVAFKILNSTDPTAQDVFCVYGNGKVRIGSSNVAPEDLLHVGNGPTKMVVGSAAGSSLNYGTSYMGFNASRVQGSGSWITANDGANNGGAVIFGDVMGSMYFSILPTTGASNQYVADANILNNAKLKIASTGLVQVTSTLQIGAKKPIVGTVHDNARLSVDGKVLCKSLYITISDGIWADYVFEDNYKMMPLKDIESFVKTNKHLPNIPSASEVEKNGANIAEVNAKLLEKLEEAYLHIIELDKRIKTLEESQEN